MENNTSHSAGLRAQYNSNRLSVLFLTKMDDDAYRSFVSEVGYSWMKIHFNDLLDVDALANSSFFWKWFMNQWNYLDDALYLPRLWSIPAGSRLAAYRQFHQEIFDQENKHSNFIREDFIALMDEWTNAIIDQKSVIA